MKLIFPVKYKYPIFNFKFYKSLRKIISNIVEQIYNFFDIFHTFRLKKFYEGKDFDLVIDVGSHKGEFIYRVIKKSIPIYSFEPQSSVRRYLKKNTFKNNVLEYFDYALGNQEGFIDLYINTMSSTSTTKETKSTSKWIKFKNFVLGGKVCFNKEKVKISTLDKLLFDKLGSKKVLLKIDVEGGENEVLQGSDKILKNCNVVLIQIESSNYKIYKNSLNPEKLLMSYGFEIEKKFVFPLMNFTDIIFKRI